MLESSFWATELESLLTVEPDKSSSQCDQQTKQDKGSISEVRYHVRCDLTNDEVIHPVGRRSQCNAVRASRQWPHLCNNDPGTRNSQ